jgi:hypothetical protein
MPLLLIMLMLTLLVDRSVCDTITHMHFDGHVLCHVGNGNAEVPVKNAEVKLMEGDRWFSHIHYNSTQFYPTYIFASLCQFAGSAGLIVMTQLPR